MLMFTVICRFLRFIRAVFLFSLLVKHIMENGSLTVCSKIPFSALLRSFVVKHHFTIRHQGQPTSPPSPLLLQECGFFEKPRLYRPGSSVVPPRPPLTSRDHLGKLTFDLSGDAFDGRRQTKVPVTAPRSFLSIMET